MKAIQKQYERKVKVNQNRDTFTTYQRLSQHDHSPILHQEKQSGHNKRKNDSEHQHIQSLKCTLKSLSQQVSIDLSKVSSKGDHSLNEREQQELEHKKYNNKLDSLTKHLKEIASKDYFSPANSVTQRPKSSTYNYYPVNSRHEESNFQKSQKISANASSKQETLQRNTMNFLQFPSSKSQTLIKDGSNSHSKNNSQNKSIHINEQNHKETGKSTQEMLWSGKSQFKSSSNKTYSKKDIIGQPFLHSKNLSKIFQKYEESTMDIPKLRDRADTQLRQNQVLYHKCAHRARITSILVADHIYTSSLDFTINKLVESNGDFQSQTIDKYRGGVEFIGIINNKVFGVGRDCFLRSVDGNFHYKFTNCLIKFYETQRSNQVSLGFINNRITLFDLEKRSSTSEVTVSKDYQMMSKWDKELYIGDREGLGLLDWRRKEHFIQLFKTSDKSDKNWMSFPFSKQFAYHFNGDIFILGDRNAKISTYKLPSNESYKGYDWNRVGLNIMTLNESMKIVKLTRFRNDLQREQIDIETNASSLSLVLVREKQLIYGGSGGQLILKRLKR